MTSSTPLALAGKTFVGSLAVLLAALLFTAPGICGLGPGLLGLRAEWTGTVGLVLILTGTLGMISAAARICFLLLRSSWQSRHIS